MHPFHDEANAILSILRNANLQIEAIDNPEIFHLKGKIQGDLKKHINSLCIHLGLSVDDKDFAPVKRQPLTKILGRNLTELAQKTNDPLVVRKTAKQVELEELRLRVSEIYPKFLVTPTDDLLDSLSELEIRGVAKRAGLPVTEHTPKNITTAFIEQIKQAIQVKAAEVVDKIKSAVEGSEFNVLDPADEKPYTYPYEVTEKDLEENEHFVYAGLTVGETIYLKEDPSALEGKVISDFQLVATGGDLEGDEATGSEDANTTATDDGNPEIAALEAQLEQMKKDGAHHMKIKAVEKQIAELKTATTNDGNHQ